LINVGLVDMQSTHTESLLGEVCARKLQRFEMALTDSSIDEADRKPGALIDPNDTT